MLPVLKGIMEPAREIQQVFDSDNVFCWGVGDFHFHDIVQDDHTGKLGDVIAHCVLSTTCCKRFRNAPLVEIQNTISGFAIFA
jgi:hypothetical protein